MFFKAMFFKCKCNFYRCSNWRLLNLFNRSDTESFFERYILNGWRTALDILWFCESKALFLYQYLILMLNFVLTSSFNRFIMIWKRNVKRWNRIWNFRNFQLNNQTNWRHWTELLAMIYEEVLILGA